MFKNNRNLLIIALIAVVNALGYGIIIPIMFDYAQKQGLNVFQIGLIFTIFSICQFISTPIIGRMSDKYGRKPLLVGSIIGTAISFVMMAFAPNAVFLFLARALDGLTAGNIPVATAVISDTTKPEDRAKGFGIIGASFGFGFLFGPLISALTYEIWNPLPFLIAAGISILAVVLTWVMLPETNQHIGEVKEGKLFDLPKMVHALRDPNVGTTFIITLIYSLGFSIFITVFQPYAQEVLKLSVTMISATFVVFSVFGLFMQAFGIGFLMKRFGLERLFAGSFVFLAIALFVMPLFESVVLFFAAAALYSLANSAVNPLIATVLSRETDPKSQGTVMGLNASYMSVGQIVGPVVGGAMAAQNMMYPFFLGAIVMFSCYFFANRALNQDNKKEAAF